MPVLVGENLDKKTRLISHASLERVSDDNKFRSWCPVCNQGILLVSRDPSLTSVSRRDRCTMCGQAFLYEDSHIVTLRCYLEAGDLSLWLELQGMLGEPEVQPTLWDRVGRDDDPKV